jgi:hypothetical protein
MAFSIPSKLFQGVIGDFSLKDLEHFPYIVYMENKQRYADLEYWYSGEALDTTKRGKGDEAESFPARVNPVKTAVQKHVSALFGEFADGGDTPPVRFRVKHKDESNQEQAERVEAVLQQLLAENNAGPAMIENGHLAQIYGGCVFRLRYDPDDETLDTGLALDAIHPSYFIGVPNGSDFWTLREAWVVQQITAEEALFYGVEVPNLYAWYIEHWTPTEYSISINNILIGYSTGDEKKLASGPNIFGFVPFVYIPHIRISGFYGEPIINDAVRGLLKELNKNVADAGDAVKADSAGYGVMTGVRGVPQIIELADGFPVINLGLGSPSISGGDNKPTLESIKIGATSSPMVDIVDRTQAMLSRELYTPDVAYGEFGGGSQRSSSSLYAMMWHLTAHVKLERIWWTAGLRVLAKMALRLFANLELHGITKEDLKLQIGVQWSEYLPRDRAELINELSVRSANHLGSMRHLLELTGDVDNAPQMVEEIMDEMEEMGKMQLKLQPEPTTDARKTSPSSSVPKKGRQ